MSPMFNIRHYFRERNYRLKIENKLMTSAKKRGIKLEDVHADLDTKRIYRQGRNSKEDEALTRAANAEYSRIIQIEKDKNHMAKEPFQYFTPEDRFIPKNRLPAPGITLVAKRFHRGRIIIETEEVKETGFNVDSRLYALVNSRFPQYIRILEDYCRPLGTSNATFDDFNREQVPSDPIPPDRMERIQKHIKKKLAPKPYLPIHYIDTQYVGLPLSTGTGYHNRHSYKIRAHAKLSSPEEYKSKPTSKGYFYNAFHEYARSIIHNIKDTGYPFSQEVKENELVDLLNDFYDTYPTLLFTRTHISKRSGKLKQRPVYAVDELFLAIEVMLFYPLLIQARAPDCCIMYGLETIRGGNCYLDQLAQVFRTFFTIDWSSFDQTVARVITDSFYDTYIPSLLVINKGYAPTFEYPTYPKLDEHMLYHRMRNLLSFIHLWYNNMTFVTQDGFGYRRNHAGVPSGQLITQYLDSYANLFVLIDSLIEFGCTDEEIDDIRLFIMGDDNSGFTQWPITRLEQLLTFLEKFAKVKYNMTLSVAKSLITSQRDKIETLGYSCNFGRPRRSIEKLVAQLCMPERYTKDEFMSARAIGIAYASCGCDPVFHQFCKEVYELYLPFAENSIPEYEFYDVIKVLPSQFSILDTPEKFIITNQFPSLNDIHSVINHYHGPLEYAPKWNISHFKGNPYCEEPNFLTMHQYEKLYDIKVPPPIRLLG
jgi:hypothetical protein